MEADIISILTDVGTVGVFVFFVLRLVNSQIESMEQFEDSWRGWLTVQNEVWRTWIATQDAAWREWMDRRDEAAQATLYELAKEASKDRQRLERNLDRLPSELHNLSSITLLMYAMLRGNPEQAKELENEIFERINGDLK